MSPVLKQCLYPGLKVPGSTDSRSLPPGLENWTFLKKKLESKHGKQLKLTFDKYNSISLEFLHDFSYFSVWRVLSSPGRSEGLNLSNLHATAGFESQITESTGSFTRVTGWRDRQTSRGRDSCWQDLRLEGQRNRRMSFLIVDLI